MATAASSHRPRGSDQGTVSLQGDRDPHTHNSEARIISKHPSIECSTQTRVPGPASTIQIYCITNPRHNAEQLHGSVEQASSHMPKHQPTHTVQRSQRPHNPRHSTRVYEDGTAQSHGFLEPRLWPVPLHPQYTQSRTNVGCQGHWSTGIAPGSTERAQPLIQWQTCPTLPRLAERESPQHWHRNR